MLLLQDQSLEINQLIFLIKMHVQVKDINNSPSFRYKKVSERIQEGNHHRVEAQVGGERVLPQLNKE